MLPRQPSPQDDLELFRSRLETIIDQRHPLVRLARLIDWPVFEEQFGAIYVEGAGRPGLPSRFMLALHLLNHMDGLSAEAVCARDLNSPYVQAFCGEQSLHLLAETLAAAERAEAVKPGFNSKTRNDATADIVCRNEAVAAEEAETRPHLNSGLKIVQ